MIVAPNGDIFVTEHVVDEWHVHTAPDVAVRLRQMYSRRTPTGLSHFAFYPTANQLAVRRRDQSGGSFCVQERRRESA